LYWLESLPGTNVPSQGRVGAFSNPPSTNASHSNRVVLPPDTNVKMSHLYRVGIHPDTNMTTFIPGKKMPRYKCSHLSNGATLLSNSLATPMFLEQKRSISPSPSLSHFSSLTFPSLSSFHISQSHLSRFARWELKGCPTGLGGTRARLASARAQPALGGADAVGLGGAASPRCRDTLCRPAAWGDGEAQVRDVLDFFMFLICS
jgi:hypothetical protein